MKQLMTKFALAASIAGIAASAQAGSITVKGSDTMVILAQKWAQVYREKHPEVEIEVTGGGSGVGLAALQNKATDICNASRPIRSNERSACLKAFGKSPREYKVALDGLSVYVNEGNPVKELSILQLEGIFTGKTKNWKDVGGPDAPIVLYSRENSSGTYEFFKEHVLKGKDFAASAQTLPGTAQVIQKVGSEKNGIGYGGAAYAQGVKALAIRKEEGAPAIQPNEETVVSGRYPISRALYIYLNPALDTGAIAEYINWIRSDEGQKVVKDIGYFPLPKHLRESGQ